MADAPTPSAAPAAAAPAPSASPAAAPAAPAAAPAPETLFTAAPAPSAAPAPAAASVPEWLPEKYRVMGADGALDLQASSQKLAEGYAAASKRIGTGDLPPEAPDGYKDSPVPDAFKDIPLDPQLTGPFRERAHKAGLTQAQLDFVMGEYYQLVPSLLNAQAKFSADEARAELSKVWSTTTELQGNMSAAERAVSLMPQQLQEQIKDRYATDPVFWQFAAHFGRESREDRPAAGGSAPDVTNVEALMASEAYRNAKHPDHATVSKRVRDAFERRAGTQPAVM